VKTAKRGGKVFIPAFSLERTQEIVYDLHVLWDAKEIPAIPIVVDSPLASKVTDVFMKHPECYGKEMYEQFLSRQHHPFEFSLVRFTETVEESKALNTIPGPMVIMAGSGMCEAGRIRHHLRHGIEDPRNSIVAVGFMAEHTLGRKIVDPTVKQVRIFDETYEKKAEVVSINAYSAHADMAGLDAFVLPVKGLKKVILVHGELSEMEPFAKRLTHVRHDLTVLMPERDEEIAVE
jgi:metallo-beta-lactamase family protein